MATENPENPEKNLPNFFPFNKAEIDYRPKLLPFLGFVLYRKMSVVEPPIHLNFFLFMILVYMQKTTVAYAVGPSVNSSSN
jgi:hypothetical protein